MFMGCLALSWIHLRPQIFGRRHVDSLQNHNSAAELDRQPNGVKLETLNAHLPDEMRRIIIFFALFHFFSYSCWPRV